MKIIVIFLVLALATLILFCLDRHAINKKYQDDCRNLFRKPRD